MRRLPAVELQRDPSVQLVLEPFERIQHISEELRVLKGFQKIERWHAAHPSLQQFKRFRGGPPKPCRLPPWSGTRGPGIERVVRRPGLNARRNVTRAKGTAQQIPIAFPRTKGRPDGCRYCPDSR